jgi:hypothetical protein
VIIAEGALSESYIDDDGRGMFHNAHEYHALYPEAANTPARYCARRCEDGYQVEAARRSIALRAGLCSKDEEPRIGTLRGYIDLVSSRSVVGWAQNTDHPEAPVCLDIYTGERLIGQVLANRYRKDLEQAGLGGGRHSFEFAVPAELAFAPSSVRVHRSIDNSPLDFSTDARRMLACSAAANAGRGRNGAALSGRVKVWRKAK